MGLLSVIAATVTAWIVGAVWYNVLGKPWLEATGLPVDEDGKPEGGMDPKVFIFSFVMQLLVAGMMRHVFALSGIASPGMGLLAGLGVGLFFITPWIAINNAYTMRPSKLTVIDGGYATVACTIMGLVLTLI